MSALRALVAKFQAWLAEDIASDHPAAFGKLDRMDGVAR